MVSAANINTRCHVRSISLPSTSHPSTQKIEEVLNKLTALEASSKAQTICRGLSGLKELYECMDDLLSLPSTQHALSHHQHDEWFSELLDGSVRLLDICSITRDNMQKIKGHVCVIQSALRRWKGDSSINGAIANYTFFRKKMKKHAKNLIAALKQTEPKFGASPLFDRASELSSLVRVLREVNVMSTSIFQSLLLLLSVPLSKPKPCGWAFVSKLMNKRRVACELNVNELERVDLEVNTTLCRHNLSEEAVSMENIQIVNHGMKALEMSIKSLDNGLESLFRQLIKSRAALLNIISQ